MDAKFERFAHTPGADYNSISTSDLMKMRKDYIIRIKEIENPGLVKRISNHIIKGAATVGTFALGIFVADKAFLNQQMKNLKSEIAGSSPSKQAVQNSDLTLLNNLDRAVADVKMMVWSCKGCNGCPGGMGGNASLR